MITYNLNIQVDKNGLNSINRKKQKIAIVKTVEQRMAGGVYWVCFQPDESNLVSWVDSYYVFCSPSIDPNYKEGYINNPDGCLATAGMIYPFASESPGSPRDNDQANAYTIENMTEPPNSFGLAQPVTVKGVLHPELPVVATIVRRGTPETFVPAEIITVLLTNGNDMNGKVVENPLLIRGLCLDFTINHTQYIRYDAMAGKFVKI